jgi:rhamnogalacturonyl hydrolase YesR
MRLCESNWRISGTYKMEKTPLDAKALVEQSLMRLDCWVAQNGWGGYDPYDLRQHPFLLAQHPTKIQKTFRQAILQVESFFPILPRRLLHISKEVNPKAMGLFASGYQILHQATHEETYLSKAKEALTWLQANPCRGYSGLCWGHPFGWQSKLFIPKDTPSSVVTAIVGDAFWRFYRMTGHAGYLANCESICEFFLKDLNIDRLGGNKICFSKTPVDHFHIHNSNLFVADFLLKVGKVSQREDYVGTALKSLNYTMGEQNVDGSICYWGKDQDNACRIDHYHSGFELRCLYSIWKTTGDEKVYNALKRYYQFYCTNLFTSEGIPKMSPDMLYPINIHSCAEAILCHSTMAPDFPEALDFLQKCVPWVVKTMQHSEGSFIYMVRRIRGKLDWKLKIPYIRWGQAWMLRGLVQYYSLISENIVPSATTGGKAP